MEEMYTLAFVLMNINNFEWSDALFLPEDEVWSLESKGMILDPDDVEDDDEDVPEAAKEKDLMYVLSIQMIQAIVKNAYEQKEDCMQEELLKAFLYYYDNDAYITF